MNLPNKITLSRIFLIPVFVLFFYLDVLPYHELAAAGVFVIAACTDFLDGYIARKYGLVTTMGKFLDPIADKVLVSTAFILMLTRPAVFTVMGNWALVCAGIAVAVILGRELIVSGFRLIAAERGLVLAADKLGKIKTVTQDVSIALLLATMPFTGMQGVLYPAAIGFSLLALATVFTVISGCNYIIANRQVLGEGSK